MNFKTRSSNAAFVSQTALPLESLKWSLYFAKTKTQSPPLAFDVALAAVFLVPTEEWNLVFAWNPNMKDWRPILEIPYFAPALKPGIGTPAVELKSEADRREHERIKIETPVVLALRNTNFQVKSLDLSARGILLKYHKDLPFISAQMEMSLRPEPALVLKLIGELIRQDRKSLAFKFDAKKQDTQILKLEDYLNRLKGKKES